MMCEDWRVECGEEGGTGTTGRFSYRNNNCLIKLTTMDYGTMGHDQASTNMAYAKLDINKLFRSKHRFYLHYSDHWPRRSQKREKNHGIT
jgi:hypothetical protein